MLGLVDGNNFYVSCERVFDRHLIGRPVAVLSNNDGCCVAMSNEFKALGIPRGTPYFQLRDREAREGLVFRSSNYELYGDMSRRIIAILREAAVAVEQYSIDEAFIWPPDRAELMDYGRRLRTMIFRWTGIPCGIGFAPTKTLAKIANHIGKKRPEGVYVLPDDPTEVLASLPVSEVWGVGRKLPLKLRLRHIVTARDLRDAPDEVLAHIGGVTLVRTALELRGIASHQERDYDADPDTITCSRTFGTPVDTLEDLTETLATFAAQAAEKLRRHRLVAGGCNLYAQFASMGEFVERSVAFPESTDATNVILKAIHPAVAALWRPGARYRKSGVLFFGLEPVGRAQQLDLFRPVRATESSKLYRAVDALNARYGSGRVFSASEGLVKRWEMKRSLLSRRATTDWRELMVVR